MGALAAEEHRDQHFRGCGGNRIFEPEPSYLGIEVPDRRNALRVAPDVADQRVVRADAIARRRPGLTLDKRKSASLLFDPHSIHECRSRVLLPTCLWTYPAPELNFSISPRLSDPGHASDAGRPSWPAFDLGQFPKICPFALFPETGRRVRVNATSTTGDNSTSKTMQALLQGRIRQSVFIVAGAAP